MARKNLTTKQGVPGTNNPDSFTTGQHGCVLLPVIHMIEKQEMTL
jgi:catalase